MEILNKPKPKAIRHFLAPYNRETRTQSCSLCGQIIHNYSGAMYAPNEDGSPVIENGWNQGEHYVVTGNPTYFFSNTLNKKEYNVVLCNLNINTNKQ